MRLMLKPAVLPVWFFDHCIKNGQVSACVLFPLLYSLLSAP